jgi:hypothetical protein
MFRYRLSPETFGYTIYTRPLVSPGLAKQVSRKTVFHYTEDMDSVLNFFRIGPIGEILW